MLIFQPFITLQQSEFSPIRNRSENKEKLPWQSTHYSNHNIHIIYTEESILLEYNYATSTLNFIMKAICREIVNPASCAAQDSPVIGQR